MACKINQRLNTYAFRVAAFLLAQQVMKAVSVDAASRELRQRRTDEPVMWLLDPRMTKPE